MMKKLFENKKEIKVCYNKFLITSSGISKNNTIQSRSHLHILDFDA